MSSVGLSSKAVASSFGHRRSVKALPSISPRMKKGSVDIFPSISEENTDAVTRAQGTVNKRRVSTDMSSNGPRKNSIAIQSGNKKTSFKTLGSKVTTLLRAKMAFKMKRNNDKNEKEDDTIEETIEELDLPKEPRFSTSMSPEAQYALMKGYEDKVYSYLCKEYPEYKIFLKRNKTPICPFDIEGQTSKSIPEKVSTDELKNNEVQENLFANRLTVRRNSTSVIPTNYNVLLKTQRSASVSMETDSSSDMTRAKSLPSVFPLEKQLMLTHRLQSAMDILDTVKEKTGMNFTSPRVKTNPGFIQPVSDYNKWTKAWSQEFKPRPVAKP